MIREIGLYFQWSPFLGGIVDGLIRVKNELYPIEFKGFVNKKEVEMSEESFEK